MIESIANFSVAYNMAKYQLQAAAKIAKIAQGQDQMVADMVSEAMENVEDMVQDMVGDLGSTIDILA